MRWSKNKIALMKYLSKNYKKEEMLDKYSVSTFAHKVILDEKTLNSYLNELVRNKYLKKKKSSVGMTTYNITQKWVDYNKKR